LEQLNHSIGIPDLKLRQIKLRHLEKLEANINPFRFDIVKLNRTDEGVEIE
jgi:hypothetical protein